MGCLEAVSTCCVIVKRLRDLCGLPEDKVVIPLTVRDILNAQIAGLTNQVVGR